MIALRFVSYLAWLVMFPYESYEHFVYIAGPLVRLIAEGAGPHQAGLFLGFFAISIGGVITIGMLAILYVVGLISIAILFDKMDKITKVT